MSAVDDGELADLRLDMAPQQEEIARLLQNAGSQQARIDYLEGANTELCIELQATNDHHQQRLAELQQRLDVSESELAVLRDKVRQFEAQEAVYAARVKYVDKNMQDLEYLLEHAVQREEKALQREKQALAALHETKKASENALGQGLPHEVALLHEHLNAAEQHCNAIETLCRRCSNAVRSKDIVAEKLRVQLDRSEEELQKLLGCTSTELGVLRTQARLANAPASKAAIREPDRLALKEASPSTVSPVRSKEAFAGAWKSEGAAAAAKTPDEIRVAGIGTRHALAKDGENLAAILARRKKEADEASPGGSLLTGSDDYSSPPSKPPPAAPPGASARMRPSPLPQRTVDLHPSPLPQANPSAQRTPGSRHKSHSWGGKHFNLFEKELDIDVHTPVPVPDAPHSGPRVASYVFGDAERPVSQVRAQPLSPGSRHIQPPLSPGSRHVHPAKLEHVLAHAQADGNGDGHQALAEMIAKIEETTRNLEILPDVGALAVKLVGESRLEAARFQNEALAKQAQLREFEDKVRKADGAAEVIRDMQEHLAHAQEREDALKKDLDAHIAMSMQVQNELDSLSRTMSELNIETEGGLASGIVALKEALLKAEAEKEEKHQESAGSLEQQMILKDVLRSLSARDEEIAGARRELGVLRATVRATVATSRQSLVMDLNQSLMDLEGVGVWPSRVTSAFEDKPRGHISSIDVDMVFGSSPSLSECRLEKLEGDAEGETQVRDGDSAEAYEDVADAYQRAAAYRKRLRAREQQQLSSTVPEEGGRETISDLEMMERRLMGFEHSPNKDNSLDQADDEGPNGQDTQDDPQDVSEHRPSRDIWEGSNDAAARSSVGAQELLSDKQNAGQAFAGKRADEVHTSASKERKREGAERLSDHPVAASPPGNGVIPKATTRADSVTPAKSEKLEARLKIFEGAAKPVGQQLPATRPAIRLPQPEGEELSKESRPAKAQEAVPQKRSEEETVSVRSQGDKEQPTRDKQQSGKAVFGNDAETRLTQLPISASREQVKGVVQDKRENVEKISENERRLDDDEASTHSFETHPESYMAPFQGFSNPKKLPKTLREKFESPQQNNAFSHKPATFAMTSGYSTPRSQTKSQLATPPSMAKDVSPPDTSKNVKGGGEVNGVKAGVASPGQTLVYACDNGCGFEAKSYAECEQHERECSMVYGARHGARRPEQRLSSSTTPQPKATGRTNLLPSPQVSKAHEPASDDLPPPQTALRDLAGEQGQKEHINGTTHHHHHHHHHHQRKEEPAKEPAREPAREPAKEEKETPDKMEVTPEKKKKKKKKATTEASKSANLTDVSSYAQMVENFMKKQQAQGLSKTPR